MNLDLDAFGKANGKGIAVPTKSLRWLKTQLTRGNAKIAVAKAIWWHHAPQPSRRSKVSKAKEKTSRSNDKGKG